MGICNSATSKQKNVSVNVSANAMQKEQEQNYSEKPKEAAGVDQDRVNEKPNKGENINTLEKKNVQDRRHLYMEGASNKNGIVINSNLIISKGEGNPFEFYTKEKKLGEGSFGTVYLSKHKILTGSVRALKEIKKQHKEISKEAEDEIMNEINILKKMDHPNIVKIFEFFNQMDAYYLVTEFCKEGELFKQILDKAPFDEGFTAYIMYQVLSAVFYCHSMGIIHRDLKPENILIERKERNGYFRIKIIDFGTAKLYEKGKIERKVIGSSYYIAPEVLGKNYSEKCDLWSCGVILYILLTGVPPFGGSDDREIVSKIRLGHYDMTRHPFHKITNECKNLVTSLLQKDPNKRIGAEDALNHPWFKKLKTKDKLNDLKNNKLKYINNLKSYKSGKVLQSAALAYLVHNCQNNEEVQDAAKLFNRIDLNGDGKITKQELLAGLKQFLSVSEESLVDDVEIIFWNIDADNNGYIEYEEFLRAAIDKEKLLTEDILRFAFRYFDKDGSGEITPDEIKKIFFPQDKHETTNIQEQLKCIVQEVDINGDGKISFEEFSNMMKNILKEA